MVWVRNMDGTRDPMDDVIRFYYISRYVQDVNNPFHSNSNHPAAVSLTARIYAALRS
jgi:hypothetical protein